MLERMRGTGRAHAARLDCTMDRQRQEEERAFLTVIEVFIWIEGDLDT